MARAYHLGHLVRVAIADGRVSMSGITKREIKARIAELQAELEQLRAQVAEREGAIAELLLLLQKKEQSNA